MTYRARFLWLLLSGLVIFSVLPIINMTVMRHVERTHDAAFDLDPNVLWSTDITEGYFAYGLMKCCMRSYEPKKVVLGTDGFMFLGNVSNNVVDRTLARERPGPEVVDLWLDGLLNLKKRVETKGGHFLFSFAPNKLTLYPEFFPETQGRIPENTTDDIVDAAVRKGVPLLDLRDVLRDARARSQIYYRTDTHWTSAGAAIAYDETIAELNRLYRLELTPIDHALRPFRRPAGDLARMLKIVDILGPTHELDYAFDLPEQVICKSNFDLSQESDPDCTGNGAVEVPTVGTSRVVVTRSETAVNSQTVLMLCDSFCFAHSQLFNASFRTVYRAHVQFVHGDELLALLDDIRPDIVILQVVERDMLLPQIGLPQ